MQDVDGLSRIVAHQHSSDAVYGSRVRVVPGGDVVDGNERSHVRGSDNMPTRDIRFGEPHGNVGPTLPLLRAWDDIHFQTKRAAMRAGTAVQCQGRADRAANGNAEPRVFGDGDTDCSVNRWTWCNCWRSYRHSLGHCRGHLDLAAAAAAACNNLSYEGTGYQSSNGRHDT